MSKNSNYIKDLGVICPICGKPDWCSILSYGSENQLILCERSLGFKKRDVVVGADGIEYIVTNFSKNRPDVPLWREHEQYKSFLAKMGDQSSNAQVTARQESFVKREEVPTPKIASDERLHEVYSTLLELLSLEKFHFIHFVEDKWTKPMLIWLHQKSSIRSLPASGGQVWYAKKCIEQGDGSPKNKRVVAYQKNRTLVIRELIRRVGEPVGVPGFYLKETRDKLQWELACGSGILFPIYSVDKKIVALRLKVDFPHRGLKYIWLSSWKVDYDQEGKATIKYPGGTPVVSRVHVQFPEIIGDTLVLNVTEGEKKATVAALKLGQITISIPGVNNLADLFETILQLVHQYNLKIVIIALDADKETNRAVMAAENRLKVSLKILGVDVAIAYWDAIKGKGLDDCILNGNSLNYQIAELTEEEQRMVEEVS